MVALYFQTDSITDTQIVPIVIPQYWTLSDCSDGMTL